ncbi:MAG: hypothetical protein GX248_02810 [Peptococcaceae bacterium]|jgi:NRPS condensation-like uncharacterized protein|nr:hypothetical protein [Peptococcaceae bacterium]
MATSYEAEVYDLMQYFHRAVFEPSLRSVIRLEGHIDENILKKAVTLSTDTIPMIRCCFVEDQGGLYWLDKGFTGEDMVYVVEAGCDYNEQKTKLLATSIDIYREPQLKIFILREKQADTLLFILNHMVSDGAGLKEYLYLLSDIYTKCKNGENIPKPPFVSRSVKPLFSTFGPLAKIRILLAKYDFNKHIKPLDLGLEGEKTSPILTSLQIPPQEFALLKAWSKKNGFSLNDVIFTAFVRVLSKETGQTRVVVPCPVDLRKYLAADQRKSITNLTSQFICDIPVKEADSFITTVSELSRQMKLQKNSTACLKPVLQFSLLSGLLPLSALPKVFNSLFTIPFVSFSNLGLVDSNRLRFADLNIGEMYIGGAVRYAPYFQVTATSYQGACTLACNFYGTSADKIKIDRFLNGLKEELKLALT